ncbi:hypothetical protein FGO68_gene15774 [Halteria grandinella]|uniref:Uncharacterized protein n=1 Tax=Halteria grandinella TaxID=5974 RepID=A0A8J8NVA2_HALGN|nr:hypothetical protein FGO68_gene15774 [Halteria grandinella]
MLKKQRQKPQMKAIIFKATRSINQRRHLPQSSSYQYQGQQTQQTHLPYIMTKLVSSADLKWKTRWLSST